MRDLTRRPGPRALLWILTDPGAPFGSARRVELCAERDELCAERDERASSSAEEELRCPLAVASTTWVAIGGEGSS